MFTLTDINPSSPVSVVNSFLLEIRKGKKVFSCLDRNSLTLNIRRYCSTLLWSLVANKTTVNGFIQLINSQISCCFVLTNDNPGFYEKQILLHRVLSYLSRDICGWLCHVKAKSHAIDKEASTYLARKGHGAFQ